MLKSTGLVHSCDELRKLIINHPDLPMVICAGEYANSGDYSYMYCSDVYVEIGEFLDCNQCINDEKAYSDRSDFEEDVEDWVFENNDDLSDDGLDSLTKQKVAEYEPYWKKCIVIYVNN